MSSTASSTDSRVSSDAPRWKAAWQRLQIKLDPIAEYLFLFAPILLLVLVLGIPIVFNVYVSFFTWDGTGWPETFVGFENYELFFSSPDLVNSVINTLMWTVAMVVFPPIAGLGLALLIDDVTGESFFKTLFFLPYAISFVAVAIMWQLIYSGDVGLLNLFLHTIGLGEYARPWLGIPKVNTFAMMVAQVWLFSAFAMVIYLAGLRSIPTHLIEATRIDGMSRLQRFRYLTFPMLRPFTTLVVATILFNVLKIFGIIYVMTGGGPFNSSETLAVTMYRLAFGQYRFGAGAAVANVLTILVIGVTVIYIRYNIQREVDV
ncbi:carbohydrate ABC transporter permease [Haloprofundus halobius]|uniref:carbohydrate ABC transporter permease n=1 Tax=Haloprofundus halobius TaxID=2876194 RepID=UPI001CC93AC1|nr:sugar ABC transporter permease [Haloprofundus halobius]